MLAEMANARGGKSWEGWVEPFYTVSINYKVVFTRRERCAEEGAAVIIILTEYLVVKCEKNGLELAGYGN